MAESGVPARTRVVAWVASAIIGVSLYLVTSQILSKPIQEKMDAIGMPAIEMKSEEKMTPDEEKALNSLATEKEKKEYKDKLNLEKQKRIENKSKEARDLQKAQKDAFQDQLNMKKIWAIVIGLVGAGGVFFLLSINWAKRKKQDEPGAAAPPAPPASGGQA
jgi:hypothetical protein